MANLFSAIFFETVSTLYPSVREVLVYNMISAMVVWEAK